MIYTQKELPRSSRQPSTTQNEPLIPRSKKYIFYLYTYFLKILTFFVNDC